MTRPAVVLVAVGCAVTLRAGESAQKSAPAADFRVLHGVVVVDDERRLPLRRAQVSVAWTDGRSDPVFTDDQGRFDVGVRASAYHTLSVSKPGYAARSIGREGHTFDEPIEVRLARGGVISGILLDPAGDPGVGVVVRVRRTDPSGATYSTGEYFTDTDDLGGFRVGNLAAGRYAVLTQASPRGASAVVLNGAVDPETVVEVGAGEERSVFRVHVRPRVTPDSLQAAGVQASPSAAASASKGSGAVIRGRVLDANARPVARAFVSVTPIIGGRTGPVGASDAEGRYELKDVPAGTYRLVAGDLKPGQFNSKTGLFNTPSDQPGKVVAVTEGALVRGVDLTIPRGSAITGAVVDEFGEPLQGLTVQAWQSRWQGGRMVAGRALGVEARKTDDRGHYRLYGVPPGSYYLVALEGSASSSLIPSGIRQVFSPGAFSLSASLPVQVDVGQDALGADIAFPSGRLARIQGRVESVSGEPFRGSVSLLVSGRSGGPIPEPRSTQVIDGTFEFLNVPPGDYVLHAGSLDFGTYDSTGNVLELLARAPRRGEVPLEFGMALATASLDDVVPLIIRTSTGSSVKGRVVVEGIGSPSLPAVTVSAVPSDLDLSPSEKRSARVADDGTFEITNLIGPMRFAVDAPGWHLKSVDIDGVNAAADPIAFGTSDQSHTGVEVVLTKGGAEVSGRVSGAAASRAGALVVVFPADARRWHVSRFMKVATADGEGRFRAAGLPPGEYWVAAVEPASLVPGLNEWGSPEVLASLVSSARRITLGEGGRATADVRVVRLSR